MPQELLRGAWIELAAKFIACVVTNGLDSIIGNAPSVEEAKTIVCLPLGGHIRDSRFESC